MVESLPNEVTFDELIEAGERQEREAEKRWRRFDRHHFIEKVLRGVRFVDGEAQADDRLAA